jgi:hypothetical protein
MEDEGVVEEEVREEDDEAEEAEKVRRGSVLSIVCVCV